MKIELGLENTYGSVSFYKNDGKFFMELDDCMGTDELEIPEYLYEALVKFKNSENI